MKTRCWFWFIGFILFTTIEVLLVLFVDRPLSVDMRALMAAHPDLKDYFRIVTDIGLGVWYLVPSGCLGLLCLALAFIPNFSPDFRARLKLWATNLLVFFSAVGLAGITNNLVKALIGRSRPVLYDREGIFTIQPFTHAHEWNSFPSGHATNSFAVAMALSLFFPRLRVLFFSVATLVIISRVVLTAHFASDVLAGALWGVGAVLVWVALLRRTGLIQKAHM